VQYRKAKRKTAEQPPWQARHYSRAGRRDLRRTRKRWEE
jgi:hypothetical protein